MEIRMPRRVTKKKKIRIKEKRITMSKRLMIGGVANRPLSEENQTFLDENKKNIRQYINDLIVYKNTTPFSNVAVKELNNRITILLKKKKKIDNTTNQDPIEANINSLYKNEEAYNNRFKNADFLNIIIINIYELTFYPDESFNPDIKEEINDQINDIKEYINNINNETDIHLNSVIKTKILKLLNTIKLKYNIIKKDEINNYHSDDNKSIETVMKSIKIEEKEVLSYLQNKLNELKDNEMYKNDPIINSQFIKSLEDINSKLYPVIVVNQPQMVTNPTVIQGGGGDKDKIIFYSSKFNTVQYIVQDNIDIYKPISDYISSNITQKVYDVQNKLKSICGIEKVKQ